MSVLQIQEFAVQSLGLPVHTTWRTAPGHSAVNAGFKPGCCSLTESAGYPWQAIGGEPAPTGTTVSDSRASRPARPDSRSGWYSPSVRRPAGSCQELGSVRPRRSTGYHRRSTCERLDARARHAWQDFQRLCTCTTAAMAHALGSAGKTKWKWTEGKRKTNEKID
uniref:Uncharacterized protein n=1 Tax=Globodera rostochiensis TaxID=31243 RepID=A0A914HS93_GLORO